jgi:hypothetical protein
VLGLVGTNGIGKSTALKILSGKLKPNLGRFDVPPDWQEILKYFRGSELQNYFTKVLEDNLKPLIKPQYVDHIPRAIKVKQTVREMLTSKLEMNNFDTVVEDLDLQPVLDRDIQALSGGELQRFAIGMSCVQKADMCVLSFLFLSPPTYSSPSLPQLHVRRALFLSRRQAASQRRPHHPFPPRPRSLRYRRRARLVGCGLPLRLHLLPLRYALDVRCRYDALLGARRCVSFFSSFLFPFRSDYDSLQVSTSSSMVASPPRTSVSVRSRFRSRSPTLLRTTRRTSRVVTNTRR